MTTDVVRWMTAVTGSEWYWYAKYLSGNDTLLNEAHQAGPYIPNQVIFSLFPSIRDQSVENPRVEFEAHIDSHEMAATPRAIWYNNRFRAGTRNECRVTSWGGRSSPILNPEATGSLCVFAFCQRAGRDVAECRIWLCRSVEEEELVQERIGVVEPGVGAFHHMGGTLTLGLGERLVDTPCRLRPNELPAEWQMDFPRASDVVDWAAGRVPTVRHLPPDQRLLRRRDCEYEVFRSVEEGVVLPRVREGFTTVDQFVEFANSVTNRRKARSGASLELQARKIFQEEGLAHSHDEVSEDRKRPDFLFPSTADYRDPAFPADKLQMLGVKTTCKDRWRQVINEADRIPNKYLLTLQEGVSPGQFAEMSAENVSLVVPAELHGSYHHSIRASLMTLEQFIRITKEKCV